VSEDVIFGVGGVFTGGRLISRSTSAHYPFTLSLVPQPIHSPNPIFSPAGTRPAMAAAPAAASRSGPPASGSASGGPPGCASKARRRGTRKRRGRAGEGERPRREARAGAGPRGPPPPPPAPLRTRRLKEKHFGLRRSRSHLRRRRPDGLPPQRKARGQQQQLQQQSLPQTRRPRLPPPRRFPHRPPHEHPPALQHGLSSPLPPLPSPGQLPVTRAASLQILQGKGRQGVERSQGSEAGQRGSELRAEG
jgi:hypothetical protein